MFGYNDMIDWEKFSDTDRELIQALPHGSGIDLDWDAEVNTAGKVVCSNSYHCMDDVGGYCGWADFSIRWNPGDFGNFRLMFHGQWAQYLNNRYGLRDYLEETILHTRWWIEESKKHQTA